ncbi:MAG: aminopeptidase P family protein [Alphaproteobacteria bacterium]|nr:aminopeptidase P family protein [Alphaproteobacteria bacterium]
MGTIYHQRLHRLREQLNQQNLEGFIVPSHDAFQGEYTPACAKRLEWITGFSGSMGLAIILKHQAAFFTDGRYTLQAKEQVSEKDYIHFNIVNDKPAQWLKRAITNDMKIGFDPWLHTENQLKPYVQEGIQLEPVSYNMIDIIWEDRPQPPATLVVPYPDKYAGETSDFKRQLVALMLQKNRVDAFMLTSPESICWLLNIRAHDVPCTPLVLAYALIDSQGQVMLFVDADRMSEEVFTHLGPGVTIIPSRQLEQVISGLSKVYPHIGLDSANAAVWFPSQFKKHHIQTINITDPCVLPKACKNTVEIEGMQSSHVRDGVAVTQFLCWVDQQLAQKQPLSEISAADYLFQLRAKQTNFLDVSFESISGFAGNGAIVHYRVSEKTNKPIQGNGLYLIDSGGQYWDGTTDITRTIAIGTPTEAMRRHYTLVLKGHIALSSAVFPEGTSGHQLDILARQFLWKEGLDYDHGTGHGVGCYLSVHEGPQRISKALNNVPLQPGMVVSNEPGFYLQDEYGIRIENLIVVVPRSDLNHENGPKYFGFETLTQVPYDSRLIEKSLLTIHEQRWIKAYHLGVYNRLKEWLNTDVLQWLEENMKNSVNSGTEQHQG